MVGELLHQVVVVVAHPVADGDEVDAGVAGLGDLLGEHLGSGDALTLATPSDASTTTFTSPGSNERRACW